MRRFFIVCLSILMIFSTGCAVAPIQKEGIVIVPAKDGNDTTSSAIEEGYESNQTVTDFSDDQALTDEKEVTDESDKVYWVDGGSVWHVKRESSSLARSKAVRSGTVEEAKSAGKSRTCKICSK